MRNQCSNPALTSLTVMLFYFPCSSSCPQPDRGSDTPKIYHLHPVKVYSLVTWSTITLSSNHNHHAAPELPSLQNSSSVPVKPPHLTILSSLQPPFYFVSKSDSCRYLSCRWSLKVFVTGNVLKVHPWPTCIRISLRLNITSPCGHATFCSSMMDTGLLLFWTIANNAISPSFVILSG